MSGLDARARILLAVAAMAAAFPLPATAEDWSQWRGARRDAVWRETGILKRFPKGGPKTSWRVPIGPGYSGPAVSRGRLVITDRRQKKDDDGKPKTKDGQLLGTERVLCYSSATGKIVWKHEYDCPYKISYPAGPRTTPLFDARHVYTLGAMGDLHCFEASNGKIRWHKNLTSTYKTRPPVWGYAAHPLLVGDKLITLAGGRGSAVVALDKSTGKEIWRSLTAKEVGYAPPVLYEKDGVQQLIVWLDTAVYSLNPGNGKVLWSVPFPENGTPMRPAVPIMTPLISGDHLLVSNFYNGSTVIKLTGRAPKAKVVWRADKEDPQHKRGLNVLMATPVIQDEHIFGFAGDGELRCLELKTGKLKWRDGKATGKRGKRPLHFATCFLIRNGDRYFIMNDQGELIIARLTVKGYKEIDRARLLKPTGFARGRNVVWSHPAFAERSMFARNDKELIRVDLRAKSPEEPTN